MCFSAGEGCASARGLHGRRGASKSQEQSESNQHNNHPGSKLKKDGRVVPHGEESSLAPRSLAELLHSTAVFPCLQMERELLDLLYHSEGGRVDKRKRERERSPHGERSFIMT